MVLITQSIKIANDPRYEYYQGGKQDQKFKAVGAAALGGVCLVIGTANIIKGVNQRKKERLKFSLTDNGVGLIYQLL